MFQLASVKFPIYFLTRKIYATKMTTSALLTSAAEIHISVSRTIRQAEKKNEGGSKNSWFDFTLHAHYVIFE